MTWTQRISERIAHFIKTSDSPYTMEQLAHGIELFLLNTLNLFVILLISAVFGLTGEVFPLLCLFFLFRLLTGGVHLKNPWSCLAATIVLMISGGAIINYSPVVSDSLLMLMILASTLIALVINYLYGPAKRAYINEDSKVREKLRRIVIIIILISCFLSIILVQYSYKLPMIYILAVLYQSLLLTPFSFHLVSFLEKSFSRG